MTTEATEEDLITEFIPLESLETEYLPNSEPLYQAEHNEHDYISTVLIENAHEEIVSSSCDETKMMKTKKVDGDKLSNSNISTSSSQSNSQVNQVKSKNNSFLPSNIIFSDKTLNTIVLAPSSSASNSAVRVNRLSATSNTVQTKTTVASSKVDGQSSNIPGLSYALYPSTSFNNTPSVSSSVRGSRTSTILCSSFSPIVSPKTQALHSLTSPSSSSSCSPVKKIILQKPVFTKGVSPTIPQGAFVEIHSPPTMRNNVTSSNTCSTVSSQSSTISSPSRSRCASSSSSQTIVIYTSPSMSSGMSTCLTTSKNFVKTTSLSSSAQNSPVVRPTPSVAATAARTIVIGTSASSLGSSNGISSALRATNSSLNLKVPSSHNGGSARAINISKHVGTNTTHHISQRSIGINTQLPLVHHLGSTSAVTSLKEGGNGHSITSSKSITVVHPGSTVSSSKIVGQDSGHFKAIDTSLAAKNILKRQRDESPSSPLSFSDENEYWENAAFRGGKRECRNDVSHICEVITLPSLISNSDEQIVGSCPSSTNRELQVAIVVGEDADPLSSAEAEFVRSELVRKLKSALAKSDTLELRFQNSGMVEPGWYMCTCQDSTSLEWLISLKSIQSCEGRLLQIVRANELPWPSQIGFRIQGKDVDPESVLSLLQGQNKKLKTKKWKILEKREEQNGYFLVYIIDPDSVKALEVYQWTLCYEFSTIQVHLLKGTGDNWRLKKENWKVEME